MPRLSHALGRIVRAWGSLALAFFSRASVPAVVESRGPKSFLLYWRPETLQALRETGGRVSYAASDKLNGRVAVGDEVWVVTAMEGKLRLLAHLPVDAVLDRAQTQARLPGENLWPASTYVIPPPAMELTLHEVRLLAADARKLRFISAGLERLTVAEGGRVNPQQLQTVRELSTESAELLDDLWTESTETHAQATVGELPRYVTRLCWNSGGWLRPSGEACEIQAGGFVVDHGFGHEEWLFDVNRTLDGLHYGFLQGVNNSAAKLRGTNIDVLLFTIAGGGRRFYVGRIRHAHVLTAEQAETAYDAHVRRGWLEEMREDVRAVGGDPSTLDDADWTGVLNICFRPEALERFDPLRFPEAGDRVFKLQRYKLQRLRHPRRFMQSTHAAGTKTPRPTQAKPRIGTGATIAEAVHNRIQNRLRRLLVERYGDNAVLFEVHGVDVRVDHAELLAYFEVKSDAEARLAIRKAIGQLLEYAHWTPRERATPRLIVVGPGPRTDDVDEYLGRIRVEHGLVVEYLQVAEETEALALSNERAVRNA